MTNFEYYKEHIKKVMYNFAYDGITVRNCDYLDCEQCKFKSDDCNCAVKATTWLYQEHTETPKLTHEDVSLLNILADGYIVRDKDKRLYWFGHKPYKEKITWNNYNSKFVELNTVMFNTDFFSFITWDDEEPWSVEDLRKLEVME